MGASLRGVVCLLFLCLNAQKKTREIFFDDTHDYQKVIWRRFNQGVVLLIPFSHSIFFELIIFIEG